ncbi:MAG: hypothetical protein JWN48_5570 [Myxococcaceae bacterium]|nr:hypothetical protein [Myxococcaceae bacterium]
MNEPETTSSSDSAVRALVELALQRIDDDAPDYGEPLEALLAPAALAFLERTPELARPLFVELRKLRPLTLWVRDTVELALARKRDAVLDGAVCSLAPGTMLLQPEGRECWLEVDASAAESTLRGLPSGWGLVITGDLSRSSFPALRRASPLRALGAVLDGQPRPVDARLDLLIVRARSECPPRPTETSGTRVLWSVESAGALQLTPEFTPSIGVLCDGRAALAWALRLATLRTRGVPPQ